MFLIKKNNLKKKSRQKKEQNTNNMAWTNKLEPKKQTEILKTGTEPLYSNIRMVLIFIY